MKNLTREELETRLAKTAETPVDPVKRVDALVALAWFLRGDSTNRAYELAREARELAIKAEYRLGQARAARTMAMTIRDADQVNNVVAFAEEAKNLFDEVDDPEGRAGARDFLASIREYVGDLAGGLEFALDALSIARKIGHPTRQGYALSSVGGILAASGEHDVAVKHLKEALTLFEGAQDENGIGTILGRLCRVLKDAGNFEEATQYANQCLEVGKSLNDEFLLFTAKYALAEIAEKADDLEAAEQLYREAVACFSTRAVRDVMGSEARVALGRLLNRVGKRDTAEAELLSALDDIQDQPVSIMVTATCHEALCELREQQGRLADALNHLRESQRLKTQITKNESRNKLTQLEVRAAMEAAEKNAEIHKLRFEELHSAQARLVEAQKMALLGKLAAGTAHELNTPVGVLRSNTKIYVRALDKLEELVKTKLGDDPEAGKIMNALRSCETSSFTALERISTVAQSFRRFTELDKAERRTFDVREGLHSALSLLEPTLPASVKLRRQLDWVAPIDGWPRELNHAFLTVLQNAAQAIHTTGTIAVHTRQDGDMVCVEISDTGRGMSEEQVRHLFDVAWSDDGKRTKMRLGLSAAYTTLQKHRGSIAVQSELDKGTTFVFRIPAALQQR